MVMDPFRRPKDQINALWESHGWPTQVGWYEALTLPGEWLPYDEFKITGEGWQINFCAKPWSVVAFDRSRQLGEMVISPQSVAIYTVGRGETPADCINTSADNAEVLVGLIGLILGKGYPVLNRLQHGPYWKGKPEKITYFTGRTRVTMKGLTKQAVERAFREVEETSLDNIPNNHRLALRWYAKAMWEENAVDKFISLYESSLAIAGRWHYGAHPEAYTDENDPKKGRDPPPRRMFGDWVRDILKPLNNEEENQRFEPFDRMVSTRNSILKGGKLLTGEEDVSCAVSCSVQLLRWGLGERYPQTFNTLVET